MVFKVSFPCTRSSGTKSSNWQLIVSDIPQDLMRKLIPFNVSVKMDGVACALSKLADSGTMRGAVSRTAGWSG